jgi:Ni/Co efflux regulator RcnB
LLIGALALSVPAFAGKPDKGKKKGHDQGASEVTVQTFTSGQRDSVQVYFVEKHGRGNCPPGLAKKNNGCLPPGQAKKRYAVGHSLPPGVEIRELPVEISVRVGPPPAGYRYCMVDGDLVKLAVGTQLIVDAIEGLVH